MNEIRVRLALDSGAFVSGMGTAGGQLDQFSTGSDRAAAAAERLNRSVARVGHYAAAFASLTQAVQLGRQMLQAADSVTVLNNQLKLATGSSTSAAQAYEALYGIAQRSRVSFTELGGTFAQIARAGESLGLSQRRLLGVTEAIGNAVTVSGASSASAQAALLQLSQGLASGTLRGEELNSVMEQTPRLARALADGLGVPIGALRKMGEQGELTAERVIKALESQAEVLRGEVSTATLTVAQSMTQLQNAVVRTVGDLDKASGATQSLAKAIGGASSAVEAMGKAIRDNETAVQSVLGATVATVGAAAFLKLAGSIGAVRTAVMALGAVLAANPLTLALLGVSAAVGAVYAASEAQRNTIRGLGFEIEHTSERIATAERQLAAVGGSQGGMTRALEARIAGMKKYRAELLEQQNALRAQQAGAAGGAGGGRGEVNPDTIAQLTLAEEAQAKKRTEWLTKYASDAERLSAELKKVSADFGGVIPADLEQRIRDKFKGPMDAGARSAATLTQRYANLVSDLLAKDNGLNADYAEKIALLNAGYAATKRSTKATEDYQAAVQALVAAQPFAVKAARDAAQADKEAADLRAQSLRDAEQSGAQVAQRVLALRDEEAAIKLQVGTNMSLAAALEQVAIARLQDSQAKAMSFGDEAMVAALQREIDARRELATLTDRKDQRTVATAAGKESDQRLNAYLNKDIGTDLAAGFDKASQSLGAFVQAFGKLADQQTAYEQARKDAGQDSTKLAAVEQRNLRAQANSYGSIAGAAKGFFKEGTTGYKTMAAAEKAFRAYEMASVAASTATKLGLWASETAAKIGSEAAQAGAVASGQAAQTGAVTAGETLRNLAKIPGVILAYMSAMGPWGLAAAGVAIAAVMGAFKGSSGSFSASNTGTGTVFGDPTAQSESIANSLDKLRGVDTTTMRYSAQMLVSLQSIDAKIGGVTNVLLRNGSIVTGAGLGVSDFAQKNIGDPLLNMIGIDSTQGIGEGLINAIGLGGVLDTVQGWWGGIKQEIVHAGVSISGALSDVVAGGGMRQFADVTTTKKSFFGLSKDVENSTVTSALDPAIARQFGLILGSFSDAVQAAAVPLGLSLDQVRSRLSSFVVSIGNIDLKGLTGTALQERLSAVFGAEGDKMAAWALGGFEAFTAVGEGYLETVVRVATGAEEARIQLSRLGIAVADLTQVENKQADDLGAEFVRQSIFLREGATGIGEIVQALQGSASDIASTYRTLTQARTTMGLLGFSGGAVSADLLAGTGGLDALTSALSSFQDMALTDAEKLAVTTGQLTAEFSRLGLTLPATVADYAALVRGIDTSTAAGQQLLGQVLALSDGYSELASAQASVADERAGLEDQLLELQGNTAAQRARELDQLDASNRALQQRIWALQDEKAATEALASAGQSVVAYINELRGGTAAGSSIAALRSVYAADLASAQAGDADASTQVLTSAKALVAAVKSTATDPLQLARETSRIAAQLQALPATSAYQASQAAEAAKSAQAAQAAQQSAINAGASAVPNVVTAPIPAAAPLTNSSTGDTAALEAMREQLQALQAELAGLRDDQRELANSLLAIVAGVNRTARVLENVTPAGDSIAVQMVS